MIIQRRHSLAMHSADCMQGDLYRSSLESNCAFALFRECANVHNLSARRLKNLASPSFHRRSGEGRFEDRRSTRRRASSYPKTAKKRADLDVFLRVCRVDLGT
jgi:hypothetical protein